MMRVILATMIFTMFSQPGLAFTNDECSGIRSKALIHYDTSDFYFNEFMKIKGTRTYGQLNPDEKTKFDKAFTSRHDQLLIAERFANIYSAFCK